MAKRLPGMVLFLLQLFTLSSAEERAGEACWALDSHTSMVHFVEIKNDQDREAGFFAHLAGSGIGDLPASCVVQSIARDRTRQAKLRAEWNPWEFEMIDTAPIVAVLASDPDN